MSVFPNRIPVILAMLGLLFILGVRPANAALTLTCTGGDFGTVTTQTTTSGPNNMTMGTTGAIAYPAVMTGPATGTTVTCTVSGSSAGNKPLDVYCDASRVITNTGGSGGNANRNVTLFTVRGNGKTTLAETNCLGISTLAGTFDVVGSQGATIWLGATMDATQVNTGGTYLLSNNAAGPVSIKVIDNNNNSVTTSADFSVVFKPQVGVTSVTDLNYGTIALAGQPGASDHVDLGTNNTAAYAGVFSAQGGALTSGQITLNGVGNGTTLEVRCDASMTLTNGAGKSIQVTGLKVAAEGSTGSYAGAGSACAGVGAGSPATTMVFTSSSRDQFFFGGVLDGGTASSGFVGGIYSTGNAGGVYAVVDVVAQ